MVMLLLVLALRCLCWLSSVAAAAGEAEAVCCCCAYLLALYRQSCHLLRHRAGHLRHAAASAPCRRVLALQDGGTSLSRVHNRLGYCLDPKDHLDAPVVSGYTMVSMRDVLTQSPCSPTGNTKALLLLDVLHLPTHIASLRLLLMQTPGHLCGPHTTAMITHYGSSYAFPSRTERLMQSGQQALQSSTMWMHTHWCSAGVALLLC
jgi:hypothetical protein